MGGGLRKAAQRYCRDFVQRQRRDWQSAYTASRSSQTEPIFVRKSRSHVATRNGFEVEHHLLAAQRASARVLGFEKLHASESDDERPLDLPCICGGGRDDCIRLEQRQVQHAGRK